MPVTQIIFTIQMGICSTSCQFFKKNLHHVVLLKFTILGEALQQYKLCLEDPVTGSVKINDAFGI